MASNTRDLVVRIIGDAKQMKKATQEAESGLAAFEDKIGKIGSSLAGVFAGGALLAFGREAAEAALEDQRAQERLAKTLQNVTGATREQIAAVEDYIATTESQFAVMDDELRPAFETLLRATKDTAMAQKLLQLALDVSAGSGKSLQEVSLALVKAYGGNMRGLKDLGIQVKTTAGDTASFANVYEQLVTMFSGQGMAAAESQTGQINSMKIAFENMKEAIGTALLPVMLQLANSLGLVLGWFNNLSGPAQSFLVTLGLLAGAAFTAVKAVGLLQAAAALFGTQLKVSLPELVAFAGLIAGIVLVIDKLTGKSKERTVADRDAQRAIRDLGAATSDTAVIMAAFYRLNRKGAMTGADWKVVTTLVEHLGLSAGATAQLLENLRNPSAKVTDNMEQFGAEAVAAANSLQDLKDSAVNAVPAIENTNDALFDNADAVNAASRAAEKHSNILTNMLQIEDLTGREAKRMAEAIEKAAGQIRATFDNRRSLTQATKDYKDALAGLSQGLKDAGKDQLAQQVVYDDAIDKALRLAETITAVSGASLDAKGKNELFLETLVGLRNKVTDPKMQAALDLLIRQLQTISGITYNSSFNPYDIQLPDSVKKKLPKRAAGGPVSAGQMYLVGERGPELFVSGQSGSIIPNGALSNNGGGNTFNVTINAGMGSDPQAIGNAVVSALRTWVRTNGKLAGVAA